MSKRDRLFSPSNLSRQAQVIRWNSSLDSFNVSKVLVVPKTTRYMFEQQREKRFRSETESETEPEVENVSEEGLRQKVTEFEILVVLVMLSRNRMESGFRPFPSEAWFTFSEARNPSGNYKVLKKMPLKI